MLSVCLGHLLLEPRVEGVPVGMRVALPVPLRVHKVVLCLVGRCLESNVDLKVSCDPRVLRKEEQKGLRVHLFNFSLNRERVLLVASATAELDAHFILRFRVAYPLDRL